MSKKGIKIAAQAFSDLQEARSELLTYGDGQDILLGQLLDDMKDVGKDRFARITLMKKQKGGNYR